MRRIWEGVEVSRRFSDYGKEENAWTVSHCTKAYIVAPKKRSFFEVI